MTNEKLNSDATPVMVEPKTPRLWSIHSVRLRVAIAIALALTIEGLMRSNLNMAVVCMLNETSLAAIRQSATRAFNHSQTVVECPVLTLGETKKPFRHNGELHWTAQDKAVIFASFYAGGLLATIMTEFLSRFCGPTRLVLYGAVVNVFGTFATPFMATQGGPIALVATRFIMGFGQGLLWPCMSVLISIWFTKGEMSTALAIATTGNQASVIVAMFATAELCQLPWGWPMAFHAYGVLGVVLCVIWFTFVFDSPHEARCITAQEIEHITATKTKNVRKANWHELLRSPLIWSIAGSSFAHNYITVGTITYLPLYYKSALNMSLTSNGILSALPFIMQFLSKVVYASAADVFLSRKCMSHTNIVRLSNSSASFGIAICFFLLCFCDCTNRMTAVILVCLAMAFVSGFVPGYNTSVVCVAPTQTAAIASFSRIWAQLAASIAPYQIGAITQTGAINEWRIVFITVVIISTVTGIFFQVYGSAEPQTWATSNSKSAVEEELMDNKKEVITDNCNGLMASTAPLVSVNGSTPTGVE